MRKTLTILFAWIVAFWFSARGETQDAPPVQPDCPSAVASLIAATVLLIETLDKPWVDATWENECYAAFQTARKAMDVVVELIGCPAELRDELADMSNRLSELDTAWHESHAALRAKVLPDAKLLVFMLLHRVRTRAFALGMSERIAGDTPAGIAWREMVDRVLIIEERRFEQEFKHLDPANLTVGTSVFFKGDLDYIPDGTLALSGVPNPFGASAWLREGGLVTIVDQSADKKMLTLVQHFGPYDVANPRPLTSSERRFGIETAKFADIAGQWLEDRAAWEKHRRGLSPYFGDHGQWKQLVDGVAWELHSEIRFPKDIIVKSFGGICPAWGSTSFFDTCTVVQDKTPAKYMSATRDAKSLFRRESNRFDMYESTAVVVAFSADGAEALLMVTGRPEVHIDDACPRGELVLVKTQQLTSLHSDSGYVPTDKLIANAAMTLLGLGTLSWLAYAFVRSGKRAKTGPPTASQAP